MACLFDRSAFLRAAIGCWALVASASAGAQTTHSYAVLSLAADSLDVIDHVTVTGSQIDQNKHRPFAVTDDTFEVAVLRSVNDALKGRGEVALFSTRDPRLFALQNRALDGDELPKELTTAVGELVASSKATDLILVTKRSAEVSLPLRDGHVGDGRFSGLGFYLDRDLRTHNVDTGETSRGFIAPFASMEVTLIDTRTMRTVRHVHATRGRVYPAAVSETAGGPWDILTPAQKVRNLVDVIEAALHEAVPQVLSNN